MILQYYFSIFGGKQIYYCENAVVDIFLKMITFTLLIERIHKNLPRENFAQEQQKHLSKHLQMSKVRFQPSNARSLNGVLIQS